MAAGLRRAEDHTAQASILVSPLDGNPFYPSGRGDDLINLETEAQLVQSDSVANAVAERIGDPGTASDLLSGLDVTSRPTPRSSPSTTPAAPTRSP